MKRNLVHTCFVLIALLAVDGLGQQPRRMQLDDLGRVVASPTPQISPDCMSSSSLLREPLRREPVRWRPRACRRRKRQTTRSDQRASYLVIRGSRRAATGMAFLSNVALESGHRPHAQIFVLQARVGRAAPNHQCGKGGRSSQGAPTDERIAYRRRRSGKETGPERFNDSFEVANDDFSINPRRCPRHAWLVRGPTADIRPLTSGSPWRLPFIIHPARPHPRLPGRLDGKSIALVRLRLRIPAILVSPMFKCRVAPTFASGDELDRLEAYPTFHPRFAVYVWQPREVHSATLTRFTAASAGARQNMTRREESPSYGTLDLEGDRQIHWSVQTTALESRSGSSRSTVRRASSILAR